MRVTILHTLSTRYLYYIISSRTFFFIFFEIYYQLLPSCTGLNGKISYSIVSGNDNNVLDVSDNGTIFTTKLLDREEKAYYLLLVKATDAGLPNQLSSSVQVRFF